MAKLLVSYDLRIPGRNYQPLYTRLEAWKATRVLESVWVANTTANAEAVRDDLKNYIDNNDGLLVVAMTGESAWQALIGQSAQTLRAILVA